MKQRQTVTTCDYETCDEHYMGEERAPGWVSVIVDSDQSEAKERLTFCSFEDMGLWASARSVELQQEAESDGD